MTAFAILGSSGHAFSNGIVTYGLDTPFPYSLEHEYMPNADRVVTAVRQTLEW